MVLINAHPTFHENAANGVRRFILNIRHYQKRDKVLNSLPSSLSGLS